MNNFRSVSYANMKKGLLFRSEELNNISKDDEEPLYKSGVSIIVDLRTSKEQTEKKDKDIDGIRHISIPLFEPDDLDEANKEEPEAINIAGVDLPNMRVIYRQLVGLKRRGAWTEIFNILLNNKEPVLFHCSGGKDRTGIVVSVILSLLGIDKETIYKEYLLTNEHPIIPPHILGFAEQLGDNKNKFLKYFDANEEYLDAAFDEINKLYGNIDNFFIECCSLDSDKINKLKNKYLL